MRIFLFAVLIIALTACGGHVDRDAGPMVDRAAPSRIGIMDAAPQPSQPIQPVVLARGEFMAKEQYGKGTAAIISSNGTRLLLKGFQSTRGVDTRLYLSRDGTTQDAVGLGPLQGYSGDYTYALPQADLSAYRYVVVADTFSGQVYSVAELR